jgi:hypothetical protein
MTSYQHSAFSKLLDSWRDYDDLRRGGANFIDRIESRQRLDAARHDVWSSLR